MKILNLGSLNIDRVYKVENFVKPKETISSLSLDTFCGGKGLNQSIAAKKAGCDVYHAGKVGFDGQMLLDKLKEFDVNVDYVLKTDDFSGHAIIQVDAQGQNNIILYGGANKQITKEDVDFIFSHFEKGDILLLQNEVSSLDYILNKGYEKGLVIALNPSPIDENLLKCDLSKVSYFIMNEVEAEMITKEKEVNKMITKLSKDFKNAKIVITLGQDGAVYFDGDKTYEQSIFKVDVEDTTAAGDTFTGYFLSGIIQNKTPENILKTAAKASALAVSKQGAADSVPTKEEVEKSTIKEK